MYLTQSLGKQILAQLGNSLMIAMCNLDNFK